MRENDLELIVRRIAHISLVVSALALLFLFSVGTVSASVQEVLTLDEKKSYVRNLDTGIEQSYPDILDSEQLEGNMLEFHIYVSKTGNPILDDYVLELRTNMDSPEWKFGDDLTHSANWIVWKGTEAHEHVVPKVILSGNVPKGIGKGEVYVTLTVGTTKDGQILETLIQKLEPTMEFSSINKAITPTPTIPPEEKLYPTMEFSSINKAITPTPTIPPEEKLYPIFIISAAMIVLIFSIFISIRLKQRIGRKKIEEYRAKLEEWGKEGYDVSGLKEVLEGKK